MTANTTEENVTDKNKIQSITLKNFKAFYGEQTIDFDGKNVLIYGENGSGKSSLARALEVFILGDAALKHSERPYIFGKGKLPDYPTNIVVLDRKLSGAYKNLQSLGECFVEINLQPTKKYKLSTAEYNPSLPDNMIRGLYLSYRELSDIHLTSSLQKSLTDIFNKNQDDCFGRILDILLPPSKANDSNHPEHYNTWLEKRIPSKNDFFNVLDVFKQINQDEAVEPQTIANIVEYLNKLSKDYKSRIDSNNISDHFDVKSKITHFKFLLDSTKDVNELGKMQISDVIIKLQLLFYFDEDKLPNAGEYNYQYINEARLSAASLSFYFALLKAKIERDAKQDSLKVLILDDALTGLEMSNRLPIVKILKEHFDDYQIFFLTHDREFYERIGETELRNWKKIEMYEGHDEKMNLLLYL